MTAPYITVTFRGFSNAETLRNDEESRTRCRANEYGEVPGHRGLIVSHENAAVVRGEREHIRVFQASKTGDGRGPEVDLRKAPDNGRDDDLIEVSVRLKADRHQRASGVCFFASANFW